MPLTDSALLAHAHLMVNQGFQFLFLVLNIGLAWMLAGFSLAWRRTRRVAWLDAYRVWLPVFAVAYVLQLAGAVVQLFQAGLLLPDLMGKAGNILGPLVGYGMLFLLLAGLALVMQLSRRDGSEWERHAGALLAAVAISLAAACLLAADAWLQTPRAFEVMGERFYATDVLATAFTPAFLPRLAHVFLASGVAVGFFMMGVAAVRAIRQEPRPGDEAFFVAALITAAICVPLQFGVGQVSARVMAATQPAKFAAALGHWESGPAALVLWGWPDAERRETLGVQALPGAASLLLTGDAHSSVRGLAEFDEKMPPVATVFVAARVMLGLTVLMLLVAWATWVLRRRRGAGLAGLPRWWLRVLAAMMVSGWLVAGAGWCMAEMGRHPWAVYSLVRVAEVFWFIDGGALLTTLAAYGLAYLLLLAVFGAGLVSHLRPRGSGEP